MTATMRTVSDVIAEYRVSRIDLLKVDVEGSEWAVLQVWCCCARVRVTDA